MLLSLLYEPIWLYDMLYELTWLCCRLRGGLESVVEELRRGACPSTGPPCVLRTHRQVSTSLRLGFSMLLTRERIKLLLPWADFDVKKEEDVSSVVDCMLQGIQYGKDSRLLARVLTALQRSGYQLAEDTAEALFGNLQQICQDFCDAEDEHRMSAGSWSPAPPSPPCPGGTLNVSSWMFHLCFN